MSESNTIWDGSDTGSFASPVRHKSKLYSVSRGIVTVIDSTTGDKIEQVRLRGAKSTGGRFGSLDYPSPIVVGDQLFYLNGSGQMFVFDLTGEKLSQVAVNLVTSAKEAFRGSPAVSDGKLILRSSKHLYCVTDKGETVTPDSNEVAQADTEPRPGGFGGDRSGGGGRGGNNRGGAGGNGRFDPMSIFTSRDANKDGKLTADELAGSRMADQMAQLDKDGDKMVSEEEFRSGMSAMFRGGRGGGGGGGGGNYRGERKDTRPDRPQRPEMAS